MIDTKEKPLVATAPPRWWRNKMQARETIRFRDYIHEAGDYFQGGPEYPSKEIAETAAIDFLCEPLDAPRDNEIIGNVAVYIGAFPCNAGEGNG